MNIPPERVRAITERLIAAPSVSPDPVAESRCAQVLAACLPEAAERGTWRLPDGRPVVWAMVRGRSPRTVILLGHYDTVGIKEFATVGAGDLAFDPARLHPFFMRHARETNDRPMVLLELDQEAREPGTWCFGRGALDMKSGLAAGIALLEGLVEEREALEGNVLFVATPDEEYESAGMRHAVPELLRFREARGLEYLGALNLDYNLTGGADFGVQGKLQLGCYVLGYASHVVDPFARVDALRLGAAIAVACTEPLLVEVEGGRTALSTRVMRIDSLRHGYSIEPATETMVELNVVWSRCSVSQVLDAYRRTIGRVLERMPMAFPGRLEAMTLPRMPERTEGSPSTAYVPPDPPSCVLTLPELAERARRRTGAAPLPASEQDLDARTTTLQHLRQLCRAAGLIPPAIVLHLLPPFYPPNESCRSPFSESVRRELSLGSSGESHYPFITDASYLAWRGEGPEVLSPHFPSLGRQYLLPFEASRSLDLDVVSLGPWGRDAHGLYERVHAPYAFAELPGLLARVVRGALRE